MLQRIQSIFLLLTSGTFFSLFAVDFASSDNTAAGIFADKLYNVFDSPILIGVAALGGALALVNIFMFKNRPLQLRLGYLLIVLCVLLPLLAMLLMFQDGIFDVPNTQIEDGIGVYIPAIGIITTILANRSIKKDDNLVKGMDRLR